MIQFRIVPLACCFVTIFSCQSQQSSTAIHRDNLVTVQAMYATDPVIGDSDDPAIWIDHNNPAESLILGTDKGDDGNDGGLHVFTLEGRELIDKRVSNLKRPNNIDVAYGLAIGRNRIDIAVCTERNTNTIRVFKLPEMTPVDLGGIPVFENDSLRAPMGIALYTTPDSLIYAIVGRKNGPTGAYLWQYRLQDDGKGNVVGEVVRKFGNYSGRNEIESIAVDNELGFVYCSDEGVGVRKYYAHPDSSAHELALFAGSGFTEDHEGISIYKTAKGTGYILVSDQAANQFHIFPREGIAEDPHQHPLLKIVKVTTNQSDGSDITSYPLPGFPNGLFVAMSDDKTFQIFDPEKILPSRSDTVSELR